jgi:epoxyqueuosine reductase
MILSVPPKVSLKKTALEIGFDLVGVAPAMAWRALEFSREWVERGYGGEMRYLENPKRDDPRSILPSVKSVVCVGLVYNAPLPYSTELLNPPFTPPDSSGPPSPPGRVTEGEGAGRAWVSRYAWGRDYHVLMRAKLEKLRLAIESQAAGVETRVYVDTGPIVERAFARLSGIGWTGKNTCLIHEQKGSWYFLGVILTSLALTPDIPAPDRCGSCTRCIEACPTGALVEPYVMDASRCIAYLTIELKGSIPVEFRSAIGANIFGCDICQDVCPWNGRGENPEVRSQEKSGPRAAVSREQGTRRTVAATTLPEFLPMQVSVESRKSNREAQAFSLFNPHLEDLASMSEEDFKQAYRHSPIKRAKFRGWLRNLCVAMGNSGDGRFVPKLQELAQNTDPIVREHAVWALDRCEGRAGSRKP